MQPSSWTRCRPLMGKCSSSSSSPYGLTLIARRLLSTHHISIFSHQPSSHLSCSTTTRIRILLPPSSSTSRIPTQTQQTRLSSSNSRWKQRQGNDAYAKSARLQGLKSRAAFKLLEIDAKYHLFAKGKGQVVVDLGYAPGSWSQVAVDRTRPNGRVLGIDLIPAQPPKGVSAIQGNFLSPGVQELVKRHLLEDEKRKRVEMEAMEALRRAQEEEEAKRVEEEAAAAAAAKAEDEVAGEVAGVEGKGERGGEKATADVLEKEVTEEAEIIKESDVILDRPSYIELERMSARESELDEGATTKTQETPAKEGEKTTTAKMTPGPESQESIDAKKKHELRLVDVVLSDMSAPWPLSSGFTINTISNPYRRMMNTSGNAFRDHAGSMDLCRAALSFASETLKPNGHFVCKFYQGAEDKALEKILKKMFAKVHREKPESSRSESKEAFFVALRRKGSVTFEEADESS